MVATPAPSDVLYRCVIQQLVIVIDIVLLTSLTVTFDISFIFGFIFVHIVLILHSTNVQRQTITQNKRVLCI